MSDKIGIIAEDKSDVAVVNAILLKYLDDGSFGIKKFVGRGCSRIQKKCCAWAVTLKEMGCNHLFVVHDLDDNDEEKLRAHLQSLVDQSGFDASLVIIPVLEMEAWFLADPVAIRQTFQLKKEPKAIGNTESVRDPKKHLRDLVWKIGKKRYLNTVHNVRIARTCRLTYIRRCRSLKPPDKYVTKKLKT